MIWLHQRLKKQIKIKTPDILPENNSKPGLITGLIFYMDFTNLQNIINGLKSFNAHDEVVKIIDDNSKAIVDLQKDQLSEGINKDGNERMDSYRPFTIQQKKLFGTGIGRITDHVTFYMTGNLYNSLLFKRDGDEFITESNEDTYTKMIDRINGGGSFYGSEKDEYGLSPDSRLDFATKITLPEFAKVFEEKTTLVI